MAYSALASPRPTAYRNQGTFSQGVVKMMLEMILHRVQRRSKSLQKRQHSEQAR